MGAIDRLYSSGRGSKLDQPVGIAGPMTQGEKNRKKLDYDKQKMYRKAVGKGDVKAVAFLQGPLGFTPTGGIPQAGERDAKYSEEAFQRQFDGGAAAGIQAPAQGVLEDNPFAPLPKGVGAGVAAPAGPSATGGAASAPTAAPAAKNGQPEGRREGESEFDYMERVKQARGAVEGAYGSQPQQGRPSINSQRQSFVDTIQKNDRGLAEYDEGFVEKAQAEGRRLSLSPEQVQSALDGYSGGDLAPAKIAERAATKKKEAYDKEFGESDAAFEEHSAKQSPETQSPEMQAILKTLTPEQRKSVLEKGKNAGQMEAHARSSNLSEALSLIPGAKKDMIALEELGSDMAGGLDAYAGRKQRREGLSGSPATSSIIDHDVPPSSDMVDVFNPELDIRDFTNMPIDKTKPKPGEREASTKTEGEEATAGIKDEGRGYLGSLLSDAAGPLGRFIDKANPWSDVNKKEGSAREVKRIAASYGMLKDRLESAQNELVVAKGEYEGASSQTGKASSRQAISRIESKIKSLNQHIKAPEYKSLRKDNTQASIDVSKLQGKLLTVDDGYERMTRGFV